MDNFSLSTQEAEYLCAYRSILKCEIIDPVILMHITAGHMAR